MIGIQAKAHEQLIILIDAIDQGSLGCDNEFDLDEYYQALDNIEIDDEISRRNKSHVGKDA